jgi:hypothetical protein
VLPFCGWIEEQRRAWELIGVGVVDLVVDGAPDAGKASDPQGAGRGRGGARPSSTPSSMTSARPTVARVPPNTLSKSTVLMALCPIRSGAGDLRPALTRSCTRRVDDPATAVSALTQFVQPSTVRPESPEAARRIRRSIHPAHELALPMAAPVSTTAASCDQCGRRATGNTATVEP